MSLVFDSLIASKVAVTISSCDTENRAEYPAGGFLHPRRLWPSVAHCTMSGSPQHHHVHRAQSLQLGSRHPIADTKYTQFAFLKSPERTSSQAPINVTTTATPGLKHTADITSEISGTALNTVPSIDGETRSLHPSDALRDYSFTQVPESQRIYTRLDTRGETDRQEVRSNTLAPSVHRNWPRSVAESLHSSRRILSRKRTAAGVIKPSTDMRGDSPSSGVDAAERRRARSISALPHGNRIAAVSCGPSTFVTYGVAHNTSVVGAPSHASVLCRSQSRKEPPVS